MNDEHRTWRPFEIRQRYEQGERDFRDLDISDLDEPMGESFRGAVLAGADFSGAYVVADFTDAHLRNSKFVEANVKTCVFDGANLESCDFSSAAIDAATFREARLGGTTFTGASMSGHTMKTGELPEH